MSLTTSITAAYHLNEASGTRADSAGSESLTDNNSVGSATGKLGNAASFNGSDTYLSHADDATLSMGDIDFTVACWVHADDLSTLRVIAGKSTASSGSEEWVLRYVDSSDRFRFDVQGGFTYGNVAANTLGSPSTGTWYFIVAWHDSVNNQVGISVNNGAADTASHSAGVNDGAGPFEVGRYPNLDAQYWSGLVDELAIWKRVLTGAEITALYNAGAGLAYPFPVSYSLTTLKGSFALTGKAANLKASRKLAAAKGSFALAGKNSALAWGRKLVAGKGSFALTGKSAALLNGYTLVAAKGAFALTGKSANLKAARKLVAAKRAFALTGKNAGLGRGRRLTAGKGAFVLTGKSVAFTARAISARVLLSRTRAAELALARARTADVLLARTRDAELELSR